MTGILTGRYIENSAMKPDIVIWDRKEKTAKKEKHKSQMTTASTEQKEVKSTSTKTLKIT